jgi:ribokinase
MPRVAVAGAVNADYILRVPALPLPGETVTGGRLSISPGGKGANQAHAAARLGAEVLLVASIGDDPAAATERAALAADGIDLSGLSAAPFPTGLAVVLVDTAGENAIAVAPGANEALTPAQVTSRLSTWLTPGAVVLCSLEIPLDAAVAAAQAAATASALVIVNPAPARPLPAPLLAGTILTPNQGELGNLVPGAPDEDAAIGHLLDSGARAILVTRGSRGATLHRKATAPAAIPALEVSVVDTVGAGDAFNGALAWSLACGADLAAAATAAVTAGAAACTGAGARAALPTAATLATLLGPAAFAAATHRPA